MNPTSGMCPQPDNHTAKNPSSGMSDDALLDEMERRSFDYFVHEINRSNGLVLDRTDGGAPASIAATGMGLATLTVGVDRGFITREDAIERTLACLRFFRDSPQNASKDATGHHGFYYHFLDMQTGRRAWKCELSSVDTAFLIAGMLTAAQYFARDSDAEAEIRDSAHEMYARVDWQWMTNDGLTLSHGWTPERGFLRYRWQGYNEAMLLYVLALGSTTQPLQKVSYDAWTASYRWRKIYGTELLHSGSLFTHQLSHVWIDFRSIQDEFMRARQCDYFENSRRATLLQREYAIQNPMKFSGYGADCWGLSACDGPGWLKCKVDGVERRFYNYVSRGVPFGPDDGTIAPWAVAASLPFAPEVVLPAIRHFERAGLMDANPYGFRTAFNRTFPNCNSTGGVGWVANGHCGINQGPIALMIANHRADFIWALMRRCPFIVTGLHRAGFTGGWLQAGAAAE